MPPLLLLLLLLAVRAPARAAAAPAAAAPPWDAAQLCAAFAALKRGVEEGRVADRSVARLAVPAFLRATAAAAAGSSSSSTPSAAAALAGVGAARLAALNATFWRDLDFDARAPQFASRRHGVAPDCAGCRRGRFLDIYTRQWVRGGIRHCPRSALVRCVGRALLPPPLHPHHLAPCTQPAAIRCPFQPTLQVPARDDRFAAARALRLIGYALAEAAGAPCPALWDPSDPTGSGRGGGGGGDDRRGRRAICSGPPFRGPPDPAAAAA